MEGCPWRNQVKMMDTEGVAVCFPHHNKERRCFEHTDPCSGWLEFLKWSEQVAAHRLLWISQVGSVRLKLTKYPEWNSAGHVHEARHTETVDVINLTCTAFFYSYCKALKLDSSDSQVLHTHDNSANFTMVIRTTRRIKHFQVIRWYGIL